MGENFVYGGEPEEDQINYDPKNPKIDPKIENKRPYVDYDPKNPTNPWAEDPVTGIRKPLKDILSEQYDRIGNLEIENKKLSSENQAFKNRILSRPQAKGEWKKYQQKSL